MKRTALQRKTPLRRRRREEAPKSRSARPKPTDWKPKRAIRRSRRRRPATAEESAHMTRVAALGCLACRKDGKGYVAASLHHVRMGYGTGMRASHWEVLPLCPLHHQHGPMGVAFHQGEREWQVKYGTELQLLHQVYDELGLAFDEIPERRAHSGCRHAEPPWWPSELRRRNLEVFHVQA